MNWILIDDGYYHSGATGDGAVLVQSGHCFLYEIIAANLTGATRFVQVHDTVSTPASGAVPYVVLEVPANSQAHINKELPLYRWILQTGLYVVSSTTCLTYTAGGATDLHLQVFFSQ